MKSKTLIIIVSLLVFAIFKAYQSKQRIKKTFSPGQHNTYKSDTIRDSMTIPIDSSGIPDPNHMVGSSSVIYTLKNYAVNSQEKREIEAYLAFMEKLNHSNEFSTEEVSAISSNMNEELEYKIRSTHQNPDEISYNYKPVFTTTVSINVIALINSNPINNNRYRLYYSPLYYPDIKSNILKNAYNVKSTDHLSSPFKILTPFTKRMIFWLIDINNNDIYLPDCDAKEINSTSSEFTISFKKSGLKKQ